ncbi:MAG: hypothetical protein AABY22_34180 [Nanoarchaeota archaeon]
MSTTINMLGNIKLYTEKEFNGLSQSQKEKHCEYVIKRILENAKDGVIISQIKELIPYLNEKTIQRHLDKLVNTNVSYKKLIGRAYLYYLNGRLLHQSLKEDMQAGDKLYSFYHIKNPDGEFIFIQEKKRGDFRDFSTTGGILIKADYFDNLLEHLAEVNKKIKSSKILV